MLRELECRKHQRTYPSYISSRDRWKTHYHHSQCFKKIQLVHPIWYHEVNHLDVGLHCDIIRNVPLEKMGSDLDVGEVRKQSLTYSSACFEITYICRQLGQHLHSSSRSIVLASMLRLDRFN